MNPISYDRNVLKFLKDTADNSYFVFEDFRPYLAATSGDFKVFQ